MIKYTKPTLHKLEEICRYLNYNVRYEKGTFNSGYCIVENNSVVVINKFFDTDGRVNILLEILNTIIHDENQLDERHRQFYKQLLKNQDVIYKTT
ncbi:MAG: hypothetical protein WBP08_05155 [Saprospiraceae bacterium]|jgi:hypothetical protein